MRGIKLWQNSSKKNNKKMALNREECRNESDILAVHNLKDIACVNPKN